MKILIVDDEIRIREVVKEYALVNGYVCDEASDGKSAVNMALATDYDCIILDIMMPVMDGLTASKTIREMDRPDAKTIPIIAMTANAFKADIDEYLKAGMNAHLAKPFNIELLKKTIQEQFL